MNLLAFDTSTNRVSLALQRGQDHFLKEEDGQPQQAQCLLLWIEEVMATAKLNYAQLDGIVLGRGPGSFTGLRVACSIAKGLAYAHSLPVYPVSALAAIASACRQHEPNKPILAMMDARMHQVYWGIFPPGQDETIESVSDMIDVKSDAQSNLVLAGTGYEPYLSELAPNLAERITSKYPCFPSAHSMLALVQTGTIKSLDAADVQPIYIRNQVTQGEKRG